MNNQIQTKRAKSFIADDHRKVHFHNHEKKPHMHSTNCDRYVSGIDQNRDKRFYFTSNLTPVRVYLNYNNTPQIEGQIHFGSLHGRKLSPKSLRKNFKLKDSFINVAKNLVFVSSSSSSYKSFIPPDIYANRIKRRSHSASHTHLDQVFKKSSQDNFRNSQDNIKSSKLKHDLKSIQFESSNKIKKSTIETKEKEVEHKIQKLSINTIHSGHERSKIQINEKPLIKVSKDILIENYVSNLPKNSLLNENLKLNESLEVSISFNRSNSY
jgi:hypothetical protein